MSKPIHQTVSIPASPDRVYDALMTSKGHADFTGAPAEVSGDEGGACSWYGGYVTGRNVELVPGERIVQVWRSKDWDPGVYSVIKYELSADGDGTKIVFDQAGHPEGKGEHLASGWHDRYWKPLTAFFSKS